MTYARVRVKPPYSHRERHVVAKVVCAAKSKAMVRSCGRTRDTKQHNASLTPPRSRRGAPTGIREFQKKSQKRGVSTGQLRASSGWLVVGSLLARCWLVVGSLFGRWVGVGFALVGLALVCCWLGVDLVLQLLFCCGMFLRTLNLTSIVFPGLENYLYLYILYIFYLSTWLRILKIIYNMGMVQFSRLFFFTR